jgi:hypothetical protein
MKALVGLLAASVVFFGSAARLLPSGFLLWQRLLRTFILSVYGGYYGYPGYTHYSYYPSCYAYGRGGYYRPWWRHRYYGGYYGGWHRHWWGGVNNPPGLSYARNASNSRAAAEISSLVMAESVDDAKAAWRLVFLDGLTPKS